MSIVEKVKYCYNIKASGIHESSKKCKLKLTKDDDTLCHKNSFNLKRFEEAIR